MALAGDTATQVAWPKFHFDAANTGYNPLETTIGTGNVAQLVRRWAGPAGEGRETSPAVAGGKLFIGGFDGADALFAFPASGCHVQTCAALWTGATGSIRSSPAVSKGVV